MLKMRFDRGLKTFTLNIFETNGITEKYSQTNRLLNQNWKCSI